MYCHASLCTVVPDVCDAEPLPDLEFDPEPELSLLPELELDVPEFEDPELEDPELEDPELDESELEDPELDESELEDPELPSVVAEWVLFVTAVWFPGPFPFAFDPILARFENTGLSLFVIPYAATAAAIHNTIIIEIIMFDFSNFSPPI